MWITGTDNRPRLEWRAANAMTCWWRQTSAYLSNYEIYGLAIVAVTRWPSIRALRHFWAKHSAPPNAASKEGVPTVFGRIVLLVLLINGFATTRTKSNMNPPSAVPDVTGTGT
jgi:hypothetical protein